MTADDANKFKDDGNDHFKHGRWKQAVASYTQAIEMDPTFHVAFSNRSAAYMKIKKGKLALADAEKCIELSPEWPKGYSRKATALIALEDFEAALQVCEHGLNLQDTESKDQFTKLRRDCRRLGFFKKIQGKWHGQVSPDIGGYWQEFDFVEDGKMQVVCMDKTFPAVFTLDVEKDPIHLDIQIKNDGMPAQMQPPPSLYIARFVADKDTLELCCPYNTQARPTSFEGPGNCELKRGGVVRRMDPSIAALSDEERILRCARGTLEALPAERLEQPVETDSEEVCQAKILKNIQFQTLINELEVKYGKDAISAVFTAASGTSGYPPGELGDVIRKLHDKMRGAGLLPDAEEPPTGSKVQEREATASSKKEPPKAAAEPAEKLVTSGSAGEEDATAETDTAVLIGGAIIAALGLSALAFALWRHRRR